VAVSEDDGMSAVIHTGASNEAPVRMDHGADAPVIRVNGVSRWFGSVVAVSDVSFDVRPGITGLLGPNGAGKTTLFRMITGLAATSTGTITVFGQPVRDSPPLYARLGVMSAVGPLNSPRRSNSPRYHLDHRRPERRIEHREIAVSQHEVSHEITVARCRRIVV
jgi:ABC-type cobalamin/Fe3+-siderophores transport system ATPase subunit